MKRTAVISLVSILALSMGGQQVSVAETESSASDLGNDGGPAFQNSEQRGLFDTEEGFNPFDLLHRSRLAPGQSFEDFAGSQDKKLDEAGADFRRRQLERLNCSEAGADAGVTSSTEGLTNSSTCGPE